MDKRNVVKNQRGFTLIEIIAVLVILGILAAVAVPKYIDMAKEAKHKAAMGQVAELKSSLNLAYHKLFLEKGTQPNDSAASIDEILVKAGLLGKKEITIGEAPDLWTVFLDDHTHSVTIQIRGYGEPPMDKEYEAEGSWHHPLAE